MATTFEINLVLIVREKFVNEY